MNWALMHDGIEWMDDSHVHMSCYAKSLGDIFSFFFTYFNIIGMEGWEWRLEGVDGGGREEMGWWGCVDGIVEMGLE